jgi:cytidine deaminase
MCRQFIREFCGDGMRVWMYGKSAEGKGLEAMGKEGVSLTVAELLPMSFGPGDMVSLPVMAEFCMTWLAGSSLFSEL